METKIYSYDINITKKIQFTIFYLPHWSITKFGFRKSNDETVKSRSLILGKFTFCLWFFKKGGVA